MPVPMALTSVLWSWWVPLEGRDSALPQGGGNGKKDELGVGAHPHQEEEETYWEHSLVAPEKTLPSAQETLASGKNMSTSIDSRPSKPS